MRFCLLMSLVLSSVSAVAQTKNSSYCEVSVGLEQFIPTRVGYQETKAGKRVEQGRVVFDVPFNTGADRDLFKSVELHYEFIAYAEKAFEVSLVPLAFHEESDDAGDFLHYSINRSRNEMKVEGPVIPSSKKITLRQKFNVPIQIQIEEKDENGFLLKPRIIEKASYIEIQCQ